MIDSFMELMTSNQFLSGGAILGAVGGVLIYLRRIPSILINLLSKRFLLTITITNEDITYNWIIPLMNDIIKHKNINRLSLKDGGINEAHKTTDLRVYSKTEEEKRNKLIMECSLNPFIVFGQGSHFTIYNNIPLWITVSRIEQSSYQHTSKLPEEIIITTFSFMRSKLLDLIKESKINYYTPSGNSIKLFYPDYAHWGELKVIDLNTYPSRPIVDNQIYDIILDKINFFLDNKQYYLDRDIPHKISFLFSGPPGTGKTTTIKSLAKNLNKHICYLNFDNTNTASFFNLMARLPENSILVIEDIDSFQSFYRPDYNEKGNIEEKSQEKVSFSSLLNSLDGIMTSDGNILIMTTNKAETLDSSIVRPGRVDHHIIFDYATPYQIEQMIKRFYPDLQDDSIVKALSDFINNNEGRITTSNIQEFLISNDSLENSILEIKKHYIRSN